MKNRDGVIRKTNQIDSNLTQLVTKLNQGDRDGCYEIINNIREQLEQLSGYIESEPIQGAELNF